MNKKIQVGTFIKHTFSFEHDLLCANCRHFLVVWIFSMIKVNIFSNHKSLSNVLKKRRLTASFCFRIELFALFLADSV